MALNVDHLLRTAKTLDLAPQHLAELRKLLARHVPDAEAWAFGSRVTGGAHEGSDLDLVLRNAVDLTQPVAGWGDLCEALQNSMLPMLVEVHDWSQLPAAFHANIERQHWVVAPSEDVLGDNAISGAALSEPALAQDWLSEKEEAAWALLQHGK